VASTSSTETKLNAGAQLQTFPYPPPHSHHNHFTVLLWDHLGELVPENFWTLWCKGRLTEADTQTIWLGARWFGLTSAHLHHPIFYRPDALLGTQPTVLKH